MTLRVPERRHSKTSRVVSSNLTIYPRTQKCHTTFVQTISAGVRDYC